MRALTNMGRPLLLFAMSMMILQAVASQTCPQQCICSTTPDGLHRATCASLDELFKFSTANKHHNINILDLSLNNITKVGHQLDRLTEVVSLDLSTNGIEHLTNFLKNSQKLVHLKLAHNRLKFFSASTVSESISSLDMSYNLLGDVPSNLYLLKHLEHLELEGNPIHCSCENIMSRDILLQKRVVIDHVECASPYKHRGISWLQIKTKEVCKSTKNYVDEIDMMMGDQPNSYDAENIGNDASNLKSTVNEVGKTQVWEGSAPIKQLDEDDEAFIGVSNLSYRKDNMEGSGDTNDIIDNTGDTTESYTNDSELLHSSLLEKEGIMAVTNSMEDSMEGSGETGSGFRMSEVVPNETKESSTEDPFIDINEPSDYDYEGSGAVMSHTTTTTESFITGVFKPYFNSPEEVEQNITTEEPVHVAMPTVFKGEIDWDKEDPQPTEAITLKPTLSPVTEETITKQRAFAEESQTPKEAEVSKNGAITLNNEYKKESDGETKKTSIGTYVCISILALLLVGLIVFAVAKSHIRKRRDRRLMRQQRKDIEKADKEMVEMNKSLLGKPAPNDKVNNGQYELVPTHDTPIKKVENGSKDYQRNEHRNGIDKDSPTKDSNQNSEKVPTANGKHATPAPPEIIHRDSLASDDIFSPDSIESPDLHRVGSTDLSLGLLNGDNLDDSQFLSPTREYVPVYSPDMGRVRIKMSETPKPKTPVLITRSRSNAGDIIITPSHTQNINAT